MADTLAATFRRPFDEQVVAWRLRLQELRPSYAWDQYEGQAHDRAFMVAGATKADLLADIAGAVDRAIAEGTGIEAFRRDFREITDRLGWPGKAGLGTEGGFAWRTRVIYNTNMRTTFMAGRRAQLVDGDYRFWVYRHSGAVEPRLDHLAWDGIALPPDAPFWATHYPPNGWGCGCRVRGARTEAGIRRMGGDPDKALPEGWDRIDPRTGVAPGLDKGWAHGAGASVADTVLALTPKLAALPERPSIDLIQDWLRGEAFAAWRAAPEGVFPLARLPEADAARIGARAPVAMLSAETLAKQEREHPEISTFEYALAQGVVSQPTEVLQDSEAELVYVVEVPGANGYVLVVKATRTGAGLFVTSFRRISSDGGESARTLRSLRRRAEAWRRGRGGEG